MIVGIGSDIAQVSRFQAALTRHGERLVRRLLGDQEQQEFAVVADPARFLAKRFAAKEAAVKALGTGLREGMRWGDIQVVHAASGQPQLQLAGAAKICASRRKVGRWHLSLSDERDYVLAFAIAETAG